MGSTRTAAVYGRESKGKTKSVADQIRIGEATVPTLDWLHGGTYSDTTSASRFATKVRGDWTRLRADLESGAIDALILWETARGSRTLTDWSTLLDLCIRLGVVVHVVSHERTYDARRSADYKVLADEAVAAAVMVHKASESIVRGVRQAAAAGLPHGKIPFGFERVYDPATRAFVEQRAHPVEAPIVVEVITRVAAGEPMHRLVSDLRAREVPGPGKGGWAKMTIRALVRNHAYIGMRTHNGETHKAVWDAIVPKDIFVAANVLLYDPARRLTQPGKLKHLLTSPVARPQCGGELSVGNAGGVRRYICAWNGCGCAQINADLADEWLTLVVVARVSRSDARKALVPDDSISRAARLELAELEADLKEARESYALPRGGISAEALAMKEAGLAGPIAQARRRAERPGVSYALLAMLDAAEMGQAHVRPVWNALPLPAQRGLIRDLTESITIKPVGHRPGARLRAGMDRETQLGITADRIDIVPRPRPT